MTDTPLAARPNDELQPMALIGGRTVPLADASLSLTDEGVARGDGAFETVGVWDGRPFRFEDHLDRLTASLRAVELGEPDRGLLAEGARSLTEGLRRDAALRLYVTASGTHIVVLAPQPDRSAPHRLVPQPAPWIRPLGTYGPAGAKTMSYGPNMAATRAARRAGGDDALLCSLEGTVLEGPTFCVLWVSAGVVHTTPVSLGIVDSISRRTLLEICKETGRQTREAQWTVEDLAEAEEFLVCSSVRDVLAVSVVADHRLPPDTPVRDELSRELERRRRGAG